jgi:hypothetical protein
MQTVSGEVGRAYGHAEITEARRVSAVCDREHMLQDAVIIRGILSLAAHEY